MRVNIIGAGHLGKTLGYLIVYYQLGKIIGVVNRTLTSSRQAIKFIGQGQNYLTVEQLPSADITFVTTSDNDIVQVSQMLKANNNLTMNSVVLHCSGALNSDVLAHLRNSGCWVASVHPMQSFLADKSFIHNYANTYCAMEGDEAALNILQSLFCSMKFIPYVINKDSKIIYHIAGVFASNYLITLAHQAETCLAKAGIDKKLVPNIVISLMETTLANLKKTKSPKKALTGPIKRQDHLTIQNHLSALGFMNVQEKLYKALGQATLPLVDHLEDLMMNLFKD